MGSKPKFRTISESSQASVCTSCGEEVDDFQLCLGGRRMTKQSVSESLLGPIQLQDLQMKYSDIVLSYHKMKISFIVVVILNGILLVSMTTCLAFIIPHLFSSDNSQDGNDFLRSTTKPASSSNQKTPRGLGVVTSSRDHLIQCEILQRKLGAVYINGQKADTVAQGRGCSAVDLLESIVQHNKMSHMNTTKKAVFHFTIPNAVLTTCNKDSRRLKCLKNWQVNMNTTDIDVSDEGIIVPKEGVYFIFNRVTIHVKATEEASLGDIDHSLRFSDTRNNFKDLESSRIACNMNKNKFTHVSYIEKVVHLQKKSELKIAIKTPHSPQIVSVESSSSFGMFEL